MYFRRFALISVLVFLSAVLLSAQTAQPAPVKPIALQGLTEALRIGGLTQEELVNIVKDRGVAFRVTDDVEVELRKAGATPILLDAVRNNYRSPVTEIVQQGPLAKHEIAVLLQVGTPTARVESLVKQRGVNFALTSAIAKELSSDGADSSLLNAIDIAAKAANILAPPEPPPPAPAAAPAKSSQPVVKLTAMKQVKKLYVEKMKQNLDEYLRAEFIKQLPGRFTIVSNREDADAVMLGTGKDKSDAGSAITGGYLGLRDTATGAASIVDKAGTVLWSAEAGDRTLLLGPLKRGGTREVASRLVQELKKFMEAEE